MKLFKGTYHQQDHRPHDPFMHRISNDPYLMWRMLIAAAILIALLGVGAGYLSYLGVRGRLSAAVSSSIGGQTLFDAKSLGKTLEGFDAKAEEHGLMLKGYVGVADPSI